jgi:hypothetical protein
MSILWFGQHAPTGPGQRYRSFFLYGFCVTRKPKASQHSLLRVFHNSLALLAQQEGTEHRVSLFQHGGRRLRISHYSRRRWSTRQQVKPSHLLESNATKLTLWTLAQWRSNSTDHSGSSRLVCILHCIRQSCSQSASAGGRDSRAHPRNSNTHMKRARLVSDLPEQPLMYFYTFRY